MLANIAPPPAAPSAETARRILLVVHGYPPRQTNGAEVQAQRKARWWQARGHRVSVVAADPQPATTLPFGEVRETTESVEGIAVRRVSFAVPDATRSVAETYAHPLLGAALEREVARNRPDLIYQVSGYLFGTLPLDIAARAGLPAALFVMDYWHLCQRITLLRPDGSCCPGPTSPADCAACRLADRAAAHRFGPVVNRLAWRTLATVGQVGPDAIARPLGVAAFAAREASIAHSLGQAGLVVANSRFLANRLSRLGVPSDRLLVVRQGIACDEFATLPTRDNREQGTLRVLYLGQLNRHKGVDLAVEAVAHLRARGLPVQLRLHGPLTADATFLTTLRARIDAINAVSGPGVQLGPPLSRALLVAALGDADVLVVPSRWYENSPNVILEAFAMGVPVVAAGHGGMAEMVEDGGDGLLFEPGNARALAEALGLLVRDRGLLAQLRAGVRRPYGLDEEMEVEEAALARLLGVVAPGR